MNKKQLTLLFNRKVCEFENTSTYFDDITLNQEFYIILA